MASEELLDFEKLLAPISAEDPCGESLRWDAVWDEVRSARERKSDAVDEAADVEADWPRVCELTTEVLSHRTKDLMMAGWLTESLVQLDGFAGLRDGLRLIHGLVENFWEHLHPELDGEGDLEVRAAPLVWLTDPEGGARMPSLLRASVPLAESADEGPTLSWSYATARFTSPQGENEDEEAFRRRTEEADAKRKRFESAVSASSREFYVDCFEDIQQCKDQLCQLALSLDEKLGDAAPGWTAMRQAFEEIESLVRRILNEKGGIPGEHLGDHAAEEADGAPVENSGTPGSGPIRSRADAIARLEEAANYLRRTEPHSPVAYLVHRAVGWARMPLEDVLRELIKDNQVLGQIGDTLGLRKSAGED